MRYVVAIVCFLFFGLRAQHNLEVFGGLNRCGLRTRHAQPNNNISVFPEINAIYGKTFGLMYQNQFHENVSFSIGLVSNSRGLERKFTVRHIAPGIDSTYVFFFKHHSFFLDLPVFLDGRENLGDDVYIFGGFGPYIGRNMVARNEGLSNSVANSTSFTYEQGTNTEFLKDIRPTINPLWAFGFNIRGGFQIGKFSISAKYSRDVLKYDAIMSGLFTEKSRSNLKLWCASFSIAYRFCLEKKESADEND